MTIHSFDPDFGWEPAIPLPLYTWGWFGTRKRYACTCAIEFKTMLEYREHYVRTHVGDTE